MNRMLTLGEADWVAQRFHDTYERLAPHHQYQTRLTSRVPWADVPVENRALMIDTVIHLFAIDGQQLTLVDEPVKDLPMVGGQFR